MHQTVKSWLWSTHLISKEGGYMGKFEINELEYNFSSIKSMDLWQEEIEDTKGLIRVRISTQNRQHSKKKYKMTNNDLQNIDIKLKIS